MQAWVKSLSKEPDLIQKDLEPISTLFFHPQYVGVCRVEQFIRMQAGRMVDSAADSGGTGGGNAFKDVQPIKPIPEWFEADVTSGGRFDQEVPNWQHLDPGFNISHFIFKRHGMVSFSDLRGNYFDGSRVGVLERALSKANKLTRKLEGQTSDAGSSLLEVARGSARRRVSKKKKETEKITQMGEMAGHKTGNKIGNEADSQSSGNQAGKKQKEAVGGKGGNTTKGGTGGPNRGCPPADKCNSCWENATQKCIPLGHGKDARKVCYEGGGVWCVHTPNKIKRAKPGDKIYQRNIMYVGSLQFPDGQKWRVPPKLIAQK